MRDERSASFAGLSPPEAGRFLRSERSEVAPGSHAASEEPDRDGRPRPGNVSIGLAAIEQQLHDETYFAFPEQRLNRAHDPGLTADLDVIANLERTLIVQMASRHHLVAAPQLIAVVDPNHRRSARYARHHPEGRSLLERGSLRLSTSSQYRRPVTPDVAGSSPVAPVSERPANQQLMLSPTTPARCLVVQSWPNLRS